jgi:TPR repeat protein
MKKTFALTVLFCLNLFPVLGQGLTQYSQFDDVAQKYLTSSQHQNSRLAQAQKFLTGDGAPQSYQQFAKSVSAAAEEGDQVAQLVLGLAYYAGRGVPVDLRSAHMWSNVAASGSDPSVALWARQQRDQISQNMSTSAVAKAEALAASRVPNVVHETAENTPPKSAGSVSLLRRLTFRGPAGN